MANETKTGPQVPQELQPLVYDEAATQAAYEAYLNDLIKNRKNTYWQKGNSISDWTGAYGDEFMAESVADFDNHWDKYGFGSLGRGKAVEPLKDNDIVVYSERGTFGRTDPHAFIMANGKPHWYSEGRLKPVPEQFFRTNFKDYEPAYYRFNAGGFSKYEDKEKERIAAENKKRADKLAEVAPLANERLAEKERLDREAPMEAPGVANVPVNKFSPEPVMTTEQWLAKMPKRR